ncbi:hypothetical protein Dimus_022168, partial [Dionaea muscipula]
FLDFHLPLPRTLRDPRERQDPRDVERRDGQTDYERKVGDGRRVGDSHVVVLGGEIRRSNKERTENWEEKSDEIRVGA